jgi:predicted DNA-binding transcriptional regulator YafY
MSSRPPHATDLSTRMLKLAQMLFAGVEVDTKLIQELFHVSWATAKRDMVKLEQGLPVRCELVDTSNGAFPPMRRFSLQAADAS